VPSVLGEAGCILPKARKALDWDIRKKEVMKHIIHKIFILVSIVSQMLFTTNVSAGIAPGTDAEAKVTLRFDEWRTTLRNGNPTFGLPIATVPGDVAVPLILGFGAALLSPAWDHPRLHANPAVARAEDCRLVWPTAAGIHFGYLTDDIHGEARLSSIPAEFLGRGRVVLEDGTQIVASHWTDAGARLDMQVSLDLPRAFGFAQVAPEAVKMDPTGTYLLYTTTDAGIGVHNLLTQESAPSGFGGEGGHEGAFRIVMDSRIARVLRYAAEARIWLPVLWLDAFGHHVTFRWERSEVGMPAGIKSITKVTALNQESQGVAVRWADTECRARVVDLCRIDFIGIHGPSAVLQGYGGLPSAEFERPGSGEADRLGHAGIAFMGFACRPTALTIGAFSAVSQPDWAASGSTAAAAPEATLEKEALDLGSQTWHFACDGDTAELRSITDPNGVETQFTASASLSIPMDRVREISEVLPIHPDSSGQSVRSIATLPLVPLNSDNGISQQVDPGEKWGLQLDPHPVSPGASIVPVGPGGFWVYKVICRGEVVYVTTNELEAESELERRREHGTDKAGSWVRCEVVRSWISGVGSHGTQGVPNSIPGSAESQALANQERIRGLQIKNDEMKTKLDTQAIHDYLTTVGQDTIKAAVGSGIIFGEAATAIGAVLGLGIGGPPLGGVGAAGGAIIAGVGALSYTGVTEGIKLQKTLNTIKGNWEANHRAVQNYSDLNCLGELPELRY